MGLIKRSLIFITAVLLTCVGVLLVIGNSDPVKFYYIVGQDKLPLIMLIVIGFALGLAFWWLLNIPLQYKKNQQIKTLTKDLADCRQELGQLRQNPLKGY